MSCPLALQVKISICPGVSTNTYLRAGSRGFSSSWITCRRRSSTSSSTSSAHSTEDVAVQACKRGALHAVLFCWAVLWCAPHEARCMFKDMPNEQSSLRWRCCQQRQSKDCAAAADRMLHAAQPLAAPAPASPPPHTHTWSKRVANRLLAVRMPPLGPSPYCFITFL